MMYKHHNLGKITSLAKRACADAHEIQTIQHATKTDPELGPSLHWTSNYGIVFIGNMLS